MAEKRMLTKKVTDDENFMQLSSSAQALYLHLNMAADDDGFCNQISVSMFKAHASVQDLQALLEKRYLLQFENGVLVIKHWRMANALRKDRYTPTAFREELARLKIKENGSYTFGDGLPDGCQMVAERLPQDSIDKNSLDKNSIGESKEEKQINNKNTHRFGVYSNVILTQEEYAEWLKECPKAEYYIDRISEYIQKGKVYPSHLLTMRKWWNEDKGQEPVRSYDLDEHTQRALSKPLVYKKKK